MATETDAGKFAVVEISLSAMHKLAAVLDLSYQLLKYYSDQGGALSAFSAGLEASSCASPSAAKRLS